MSNKMTTIEKNSDSKTIIVGVKCKPKINAKSYCVLLFILYIFDQIFTDFFLKRNKAKAQRRAEEQ